MFILPTGLLEAMVDAKYGYRDVSHAPSIGEQIDNILAKIESENKSLRAELDKMRRQAGRDRVRRILGLS